MTKKSFHKLASNALGPASAEVLVALIAIEQPPLSTLTGAAVAPLLAAIGCLASLLLTNASALSLFVGLLPG